MEVKTQKYKIKFNLKYNVLNTIKIIKHAKYMCKEKKLNEAVTALKVAIETIDYIIQHEVFLFYLSGIRFCSI